MFASLRRSMRFDASLGTILRSLLGTGNLLDPTKYGMVDYDFYAGLIDFNKAKANGVKRAIIRVGQGFAGIDSQLKNNQKNSKAAGIPRDFYWFLDPRQSANGQATACVNALGGDVDSDSTLFADFESTVIFNGSHLSASFLWGFLQTVHTLMPNLKLGIYTGYSYWASWGSTDPKYNFGQYRLWIAWPVNPYQTPKPLAPWGTNWYYHQWTFAGDGPTYGTNPLVAVGVDLDYMNPAVIPTPTPTPSGTPATFTVIGDPTSRIRSDPSFPADNSNIVGMLVPGDSVYGTMTPDGLWLKMEGYMYHTVVSGTAVNPTPPPPPPPPTLGLYRILTDGELPASYDFGGKSRTAQPGWDGNPMTPATVKLHGKTPVTNFSPEAAALVETLDTPHGTFGYVTRTKAGWANANQIWPDKMEPIVFEGNVVDVVAIQGNQAFIRLWAKPNVDPVKDAAVIHRWTNIDINNNLHGTTNPAGDGTGYIVLDYSNDGSYWIELDRLVKV